MDDKELLLTEKEIKEVFGQFNMKWESDATCVECAKWIAHAQLAKALPEKRRLEVEMAREIFGKVEKYLSEQVKQYA